ncbi:hypothetical protein ACIPPQ_21730, partial [Sphingopyxis sp. LARHCG72]
PRLMLLQYRDDLLFAEPASLHSVRLLRVGLYSNSVTFQGSTSAFTGIGFSALPTSNHRYSVPRLHICKALA